MFFKNLTIYRLPEGWFVPPQELREKLPPVPPMGQFDRRVHGFVSPAPEGLSDFTFNGGQQLIALAVDEKMLPAAVVKQEVAKRAKLVENEQNCPVSRRQLRELRETVTQDLLKVALVKRRVTRAWIDPANRWFVVDTSSQGRADEVVSAMREALGTFAIVPFEAEKSIPQSMGLWYRTEPMHCLAIDDDIELQATDRTRATVKYSRHQPNVKEIEAHLNSGKVITKLGLTFCESLSFTLTNNGQVKRVEFLDLKPDTEQKEPQERYENDFALMVLTFGNLLAELDKALSNA